VLLVVWIVVAVLAVLVLGSIGFGVLGALKRLQREVRGLEGDLRPVLTEVQATQERIAAQREDDAAGTPGSSGSGRVGSPGPGPIPA
jgi:hypothetical protein